MKTQIPATSPEPLLTPMHLVQVLCSTIRITRALFLLSSVAVSFIDLDLDLDSSSGPGGGGFSTLYLGEGEE